MSVTKKMTAVNSVADIPAGMTEAEAHEFWKTHEVGEALIAEPLPDDGFVLPPVRTAKSKATSIRLGTELERRLRALAAKKGTSYQTLLKEFVLERTYEEEKRLGLVGAGAENSSVRR